MVSLPYVPERREASKADRNAPSFLRRYATATTAVLFAIAAGTGVLMFFHVGGHTLTGLHEWLGMAFVGAALLHVVRNRTAFAKVATARRTRMLLGLAFIVSAGFIGAAQSQAGANPLVALARATETAPISAVAPVLDMPVEEMIARLEMVGVRVEGPEQSLTQVAAAQGTDTHRLLSVVLKTAGESSR